MNEQANDLSNKESLPEANLRTETVRNTYKAKEQREIERIRRKDTGEEEGEEPLQKLRRLDRQTTDKSSALSLAVGIIGALIFGVGMCCTMVWQGMWFIPGIFIGLAGIAVAACAYPVYKAVLKAERKRVAPKVLRICEELEGKKPQA